VSGGNGGRPGAGAARTGAVALVCGTLVALAGCSASTSTGSTTTGTGTAPAASATTPGAAGAVAPLTGLTVSAAVAQRPAVAVALAGSSLAGLGSADVVFQELAGPARYLAVFQSAQAAAVGPVTSTRPADGQALSVLHAVTGYAGGTRTFVSVLDATKIIDAGYAGHASLYSAGPGGLTTSTAALAGAARSAGPPPELFSYRTADAPLASVRQTNPVSVRIDVPGQPAQRWHFDARTDRWVPISGGPQVSVANLVVQVVPFKTVYLSRKYGQTAQSARMVGTGQATVFSGAVSGGSSGTAAVGTWVKPGLAAVTNYLDAAGAPMDFTPGPTWIVLAPAGTRAVPDEGLSP
jgi:hypothetical protein